MKGERVQAYKNLHRNCYSIRRRGRPVTHVRSVRLTSPIPHVSESGRLRVITRRCRSVHAWITGTVESADAEESAEGMREASYNPYRASYFYDRETGKPLPALSAVLLTPAGMFYR
jgi:hypothetical protein